MEYLDLSPYEYRSFPLPLRNVGWLGTEWGVQGVDLPPLAAADLQLLRSASRLLGSVTLGTHRCEFCPEDAAVTGNGEYRYYLLNGDVYCAPEMVLHYLGDHGYRPPDVFLQGLRETGELEWDDRAERLRKVLLDPEADLGFRCAAVVDLPNWRDARALDAVQFAAHDEELAVIMGVEIGQSLVACLGDDLRAEDYPSTIGYGIDHARRLRRE
ncbi:hypothetical protein [Actinoplanes friuliensis]|uniref:DUF7919 domain-containing protein n=1 Tax=Actinoplanes friuliensis DSM 7358 TaxID=1246995 RepID=U5VQ05_9ACTN|nr:hypothetical protein [Actinoplanes friuliensis]AGZ39033.1 hypothetical protein AFR_03720 [Actinoplanes friuliensis DSM 7358]